MLSCCALARQQQTKEKRKERKKERQSRTERLPFLWAGLSFPWPSSSSLREESPLLLLLVLADFFTPVFFEDFCRRCVQETSNVIFREAINYYVGGIYCVSAYVNSLRANVSIRGETRIFRVRCRGSTIASGNPWHHGNVSVDS